MAFNWKLVIILIGICAGLLIIVDYAVAEESNVTIEIEPIVAQTPTPHPTQVPMIQQGDSVYVGDYVDVSGFCGGYSGLAYWDGYAMYDEYPSYNLTFSNGKSAYTNFYVDPSIFDGRYGRWYKYNNKFESHGNNIAFIVMRNEYRNITTTFQNGTIVFANKTTEHEYPTFSVEEQILPEKRIKDYIISTEDSFNISTNKGLSALWIFNNDNTIIYTVNTNGELFLSEEKLSVLSPGQYKMIIQSSRENESIFDIIYDERTKEIKWFDRNTFIVNSIKTEFLTPEMAIKKMSEIFPNTRDQYEIKTLIISYPEITINRMDEIYSGNAKTIMNDVDAKGIASIKEVLGYTNVKNGMKIYKSLAAVCLVTGLAIIITTSVSTIGILFILSGLVGMFWENIVRSK